MTARRLIARSVLVVLALGLFASAGAPRLGAIADTLPDKLSDQEMWKLREDLSEPDGYFRSDNLLSNEIWLQYVLDDLLKTTTPGGVYLGVGPEQNFTYITATKPKMVFITDIRRGNLHTQLMYKALFEMSADRADFVGRLFTKKRPEKLTAKSTIAEIMNAYAEVATGPETVYKENLQAIKDWLTKKPHTLPLGKDDLDGIEYVYYNFYWFGPPITYNSSQGNGNMGRGNMASYYDLMIATDAVGVMRGFLSSDESFQFMKQLEDRNMLVPVVGNFGGPKALRAVGKYVREHGATVSAFYLSNVEQYLRQDGIWGNFCSNVASMPLTDKSTFIRSAQGGGGGFGGLSNSLGSMAAETKGCGG